MESGGITEVQLTAVRRYIVWLIFDLPNTFENQIPD